MDKGMRLRNSWGYVAFERPSAWILLGVDREKRRVKEGIKALQVQREKDNTWASKSNSSIARLDLVGSSTNGPCPDSSNHKSFFDGAVSASK